jgi:hypothetical protein
MICFASEMKAQDSVKLKQIDSIVYAINNSGLKIENDTIRKNTATQNPKGYLTMMRENGELRKYEFKMVSVVTTDGNSAQSVTSSTFYYWKRNLIKVEEYAAYKDLSKRVNWYFDKGKLIHETLGAERSAEYAELLLSSAREIQLEIERK